GVGPARGLGRDARNALELLLRGRDHALDRAEVLEERPAARRPDAFELVEEGGEAARLAPLPVEAEGEAVRLVAQTLQELKPRVVAREHDRLGPAGDEDLLDALRERNDCDARQIVRLHRFERRRQLALAAVDDDE